jgi:hypothetical protein
MSRPSDALRLLSVEGIILPDHRERRVQSQRGSRFPLIRRLFVSGVEYAKAVHCATTGKTRL